MQQNLPVNNGVQPQSVSIEIVLEAVPEVVAVAVKNNLTKVKAFPRATAISFVKLCSILIMLHSFMIASAQITDSSAAKLPVDTLLKAQALPHSAAPARQAPVAIEPGKDLGQQGHPSGTDTAGPKPDSTLQKALRPFSLKLPGSKVHTPQGATIRSLILPGWGQAYNHEYWKVPLAVAAVGIPIYLFLDNSKEYNSARKAYSVVFEEMPVISGGKGKLDAAKFATLEQKFQDAYNSYKKVGGNYVTNFLSTIQSYRNTFRQYRDYSIVAALLGWGLQIADATVFGHLHGFDVSDDLSIRVKPVYFQYARIPGIGLSISLK